MIYLHKIFPLILSPIVLTIILIAYVIVARRNKVLWIVIIFLYLVSIPIISNALFRYAEEYQVRRVPEQFPEVDAIVVLSGMLLGVQSTQGVVMEWSDADRFFGGVELYKLKKAKILIFTGGVTPWQPDSPPEGSVLKNFAEEMGVPATNILVTDGVQNTEQEAIAVKKLLNNQNSTILLVTSAFHMSRARQIFQYVGFKVHEYPVDFRIPVHKITLMDFLPRSESLMMTEIAVREQVGRLFYRIKFFLS